MNHSRKISELHSLYQARKLSPIEVTQGYLEAAKKSQHNAFLTLCEDRALDQAKKAQKILDAGGAFSERYPLLGVVMGIKDLITVKDVRNTCGSKILENYVPPYTATSVARLENAGAIVIGKTNLDEFGMGSSNENSAYGPVQHPSFPEYVPGGSSGGSATAVKAGLCHASLGTDTGGSIRLPASYCGLVGVKPTYGRVSRYGMVAYGSSLDQIGPMTQSVEDSARILEVMSGGDDRDSTSSQQVVPGWSQLTKQKLDWSKLRVGIPQEYMGDGLDTEVRTAVEKTLTWLDQQGAKVQKVQMPYTKYAIPTYYVVAVSEASSNLARFDGIRYGARPPEAEQAEKLNDFYKKVRGLFGEEVKRRILLGTFALSSGYYDAYYQRACKVRRLIQQDFLKVFETVDILISPVAPTTAFKRGEKAADPLQLYLVDVLTTPASLAGMPAMSLPISQDSKGLPIGLQLIAPHFGEEIMLRVAHGLETQMGVSA